MERPCNLPVTSGYDMDYTLIHYDVEAWEGRAYQVRQPPPLAPRSYDDNS